MAEVAYWGEVVGAVLVAGAVAYFVWYCIWGGKR